MFRYEKISSQLIVLQGYIVKESKEIDTFVYKECDYKKDNVLPVIDESFVPYIKNSLWGGPADSHCWFYTRLDVPEDDMELSVITGKEDKWDAANPQFIVYVDGKIVQALDINHRTYIFDKKGIYDIYLYAYSGTYTTFSEFKPTLNKINRLAEQLYYDVKVPLEICQYLPKEDYDRIRILEALNNGMQKVNFLNPHSNEFNNSLKEAIAEIRKGLYSRYAGSTDVATICIGHTHIDIAWKWTIKQTREKAVRSFSTVVRLMKKYPEYKFMSSQALLFKFVKEDAPELYEEIKQLVSEGRFEVEGAMWVEADCNLSGGESLIRQILYGKQFFIREFGKDCNILWLPDVFGYSAALPQILKKSGVNTFVTSKISWNETNKMPNDTFMWQGIDGTEIFTYFLTAQDKELGKKPANHTTYVADITPAQIAGAWDRYSNKLLNKETLLTFGFGDGGGGPTAKMLEYQRRLKYGIIGCPKAEIDTVSNFIAKLKENVESNNKYLPKWVGELYLEFHRGTYTSMAKNKLKNRKGEFLLRNIEWLSVMSNGEYKYDEIGKNWEILLTNQFHDIIPGSSIKEVYDESDESYARMFDSCNLLLNENIEAIKSRINTDGGILVFNPNSFVNSDIVCVDGKNIYVEDIPALGYKVCPLAENSEVTVGNNVIENSKIRVSFDEKMQIASVFDKEHKRELLCQSGNRLVAYEDIPKSFDAWEITDYYKEKPWDIDDFSNIEIIDNGASKGILVERIFNNSVIIQEITIAPNSRRIDFETYIDWKERQILLKAHFPVNVHSNKATYDIQYGTVERPNHYNTSWDAAKFEVCAHKFADLSQPDYGVSLMSDCKYGYSILGNDMAITLLKSAVYPNPEADKCEHRFTYSLYVHEGDHRNGNVSEEGYRLNNPMLAYKIPKQSGILNPEYSFVSVSTKNVFIEAIKRAEADESIVIRLYDAFGICSDTTLSFGFNLKQAYITDMSEKIVKELEIKENRIMLTIKPFEIVTLKISSR